MGHAKRPKPNALFLMVVLSEPQGVLLLRIVRLIHLLVRPLKRQIQLSVRMGLGPQLLV